ncbi:hypothetical protein [Streptomyces sp. URMC 123]|uniref:hypothetical protein n=1 Tax=Streptomyces sp. URMC 123 TaxID=3423403 RepID=UPI003F19BFA6
MKRLARITATVALLCGAVTALAPPAHAAPAQLGDPIHLVGGIVGGGPGPAVALSRALG